MFKYAYTVIIGIILIIVFGCGKKDKELRLETGSEGYNVASMLSEEIPYLDPDINNILVTSDIFNVSSGEVIQTLVNNLGSGISRLKSMDKMNLKVVIQRNAANIAEKKILLAESKKNKIQVSKEELESTLKSRYANFGGEEKFLSFLKENNISLDHVKEEVESGLKIQKYLEKTMMTPTVTQEEIMKEHNKEVKATVRHILLKTEGKNTEEKKVIKNNLETILARARKGEKFANLASEYSEDPGSKNTGGLYEDFGRGVMVKPFDEASFNTPVGEISDIVETQYGYHIIKVVERKSDERPLEQVQKGIEERLKKTKKNILLKDHLNKLKQDVNFQLVEF
jgi:parvulin-like peptidyl-prolyl isomerase